MADESPIDPARRMAEMDEAELKQEPADVAAEQSQESEFKEPAVPPSASSPASAKIVVAAEDEPFTEDEIIRRKLMFDGDGGGDDRRLNILMKTFFTWCRSDPGRDKDQMYNKMFYLLDDAELSMKKAMLVQEMNDRELVKYESLTHELDERIDSARNDIFRVKEDLQQAKNVRKNRMEYDPIVARIKELPTRKQSVDKIDRMKIQANILQEKIQELDQRLEMRKTQFQQLSELAHDLHNKLNQDEALALEDLPDEVPPEGPAEPPAGSSAAKRKLTTQ